MTSTPPPTASLPGPPAPLVVAAGLAAIQGVLLALYGVAEISHFDADRAAMNVTTTVFFLGYGAALIACAWAVYRLHSWARSPLVLAQLIWLGVAWSFREPPTTAVAITIAVAAVVVLLGLLNPSSIEALSAEDN